MVKLRLTRLGKTHAPFYRIVAIDSRQSRDGKALEVIGHYDPTKEPKVCKVNSERAKYWLSEGAVPTDTVKYLLVKYGGIELIKAKSAKVKTNAEAAETVKEAAAEAQGE